MRGQRGGRAGGRRRKDARGGDGPRRPWAPALGRGPRAPSRAQAHPAGRSASAGCRGTWDARGDPGLGWRGRPAPDARPRPRGGRRGAPPGPPRAAAGPAEGPDVAGWGARPSLGARSGGAAFPADRLRLGAAPHVEPAGRPGSAGQRTRGAADGRGERGLTAAAGETGRGRPRVAAGWEWVGKGRPVLCEARRLHGLALGGTLPGALASRRYPMLISAAASELPSFVVAERLRRVASVAAPDARHCRRK